MAWKGPAAWSKNEQRAGDRLPYDRHVDDKTIQLRDGSLMRVLHLAGLAFETEDAQHLNHTQAVRETIFRSALDARFIVYHHVIRRRVSAELEADYTDAFSGHLHRQWSRRLGGQALFANELFLTILRRPPRANRVARTPAAPLWAGRRGGVDQEALRDLESAVLD